MELDVVERPAEERHDDTTKAQHRLPKRLDVGLLIDEVPLDSDCESVADARAIRTCQETGTKHRLRDTEKNADGEDRAHVKRKGKTKEKSSPDHHGAAEDLGDRKALDEVVGEGLSGDQTDPEEGRSQRVVLTLGADVFKPAHNG